MQIVYIIEMLRNGDRETHSYIVGVFSDRKIAEYEAQLHINMRAGKYNAEIHREAIDGYAGRSLVCVISETEDDDELENAIQSRRDWLKYREVKLKEFNAQKNRD